jgi:hypothetical protein
MERAIINLRMSFRVVLGVVQSLFRTPNPKSQILPLNPAPRRSTQRQHIEWSVCGKYLPLFGLKFSGLRDFICNESVFSTQITIFTIIF